MYPLNMSNLAVGGFAVANTEDEHKALSSIGYEPAFVEPEKSAEISEVEALRTELDAKGIAYDKRWSVAKLKAALEG